MLDVNCSAISCPHPDIYYTEEYSHQSHRFLRGGLPVITDCRKICEAGRLITTLYSYFGNIHRLFGV